MGIIGIIFFFGYFFYKFFYYLIISLAVAQQQQKNCMQNSSANSLIGTNHMIPAQLAVNVNAQHAAVAAQHQRQMMAAVAAGTIHPHLQVQQQQQQNILNLNLSPGLPCRMQQISQNNLLNFQHQHQKQTSQMNQAETKRINSDTHTTTLSSSLSAKPGNLTANSSRYFLF